MGTGLQEPCLTLALVLLCPSSQAPWGTKQMVLMFLASFLQPPGWAAPFGQPLVAWGQVGTGEWVGTRLPACACTEMGLPECAG
jgi:hypothetical protein